MAANDTERFLTALYGPAPAELRFLVWTLPDKRSQWWSPDDVHAAAAAARELDQHDVYVGCGLSTRDRGPRQRIAAKDVAGIVGLWADVDIADDEAHTKQNLPADQAQATELVNAFGPEPSVLVHSGHGLQAWWLFVEPWLFDGNGDRTEAAALATRWNLTQRVRAAERGLTVDATQDLARVLRLPGTTNRKAAPVPVRLLHCRTRTRYNPSDFDDYLADDEAASMLGGRRTHAVGQLRLTADAAPPFEKFQALMANDTRFAQTWERKRSDLSDTSASSYDLALANVAAACGWADQEITDLLVASRRHHGDDLKLRQDYYARTISRARDDQARAASTEEIEDAAQAVERAEVVGDQRGAARARKGLLEHLARVLGIEVTRFVRFTQDPPRYRMETTGGHVTLGYADAILSQSKMRTAIAGATKIVIPRFKAAKWDTIAQAIFSACEDEDTGIESTEEGVAFAWLTEYLQDRQVLTNRDEAASTMAPFDDGDGLHVFGPAFRKWLILSRGDRVTPNRMGEVLRAFGCEHKVVNVLIDGKRTSRSVWHVPGLEAALVHHQQRRAQAAGQDGPDVDLSGT